MRRIQLLLAIAFAVAGCVGGSSPAALPSASIRVVGGPSPAGSAAPIAVLGTENFYADLLNQIGGTRVSATSLLNDPNADPHAFESSPEDAAVVADARLVIVNGLGYDALHGQAPRGVAGPESDRDQCPAARGPARRLECAHLVRPADDARVAAAVAAALASIDPANASYFNARAALYDTSLVAADG